MRRRLTHQGKDVTWEEVDFSDMDNPTVASVMSQMGGWRPHDPIVVKPLLLRFRYDQGTWN